MVSFMLNRQVSVPAGYAERGCVLVSYRLPLLRHCFVLCSESTDEGSDDQRLDLMTFFFQEAVALAEQSVGDRDAFMLIHSGRSVRKRESWHLHVFVVQRRWQKAWVYTVLGAKNFCLAGCVFVRGLFASRREPDPAIERACRAKPGPAVRAER